MSHTYAITYNLRKKKPTTTHKPGNLVPAKNTHRLNYDDYTHVCASARLLPAWRIHLCTAISSRRRRSSSSSDSALYTARLHHAGEYTATRLLLALYRRPAGADSSRRPALCESEIRSCRNALTQLAAASCSDDDGVVEVLQGVRWNFSVATRRV